ncbi:MAG: Uma2 family endonuclease [Hyphomonadaceae bacterium]|nr:Uma2 family endonuclease [Hyphomonadaceae bacterium]
MADTTLREAPPEAEPAEDRVRFRASDVRRMLDAGILDDEGRYEVIDGEIIAMMAHNPPHMRVKRWILDQLFRQLGNACWIDSEPSFYIEPDGDYTLPDLIVYPRALEAHLVRGIDALLVVEVADKTLKKDRGRKARLYARHGVRDYWVVNAQTLATYRYANPVDGRYPPETEHAPDEALIPALLPQVSLRMRDVEE